MGGRQLAGVGDRHRSRRRRRATRATARANRRAASNGRNRRSSRLHSSNDGGKRGHGALPRCRGRARGTVGAGPPSRRSPRVDRAGCADHLGIVGPDADRDRATGVRADQPHPGGMGLGDHVGDRRPQVVDPALEAEVALAVAAARNVNVIAAKPSSLAIRSISSGKVPADCRASSGPVGNPWQSTSAGSGSGRPIGREVGLEAQARREELTVQDCTRPPPSALRRGLRRRRRLPGEASVYPAVAGFRGACPDRTSPRPRRRRSRRSPRGRSTRSRS